MRAPVLVLLECGHVAYLPKERRLCATCAGVGAFRFGSLVEGTLLETSSGLSPRFKNSANLSISRSFVCLFFSSYFFSTFRHASNGQTLVSWQATYFNFFQLRTACSLFPPRRIYRASTAKVSAATSILTLADLK